MVGLAVGLAVGGQAAQHVYVYVQPGAVKNCASPEGGSADRQPQKSTMLVSSRALSAGTIRSGVATSGMRSEIAKP